ncbi:MAG: Jag N-terminal domain-containing protein [Lachnospiraceae bacterium]|nr:Jag N-terminal domain-containing protein [Lachnospiraceae bacterium]
MSQEYIEITERTVSDAITVACQKLGVPSERLEYEVLEQGKAGFLGIGARAAKIRARIRSGAEDIAKIDTSAIISDVLSGREEKKAKDPAGKAAGKKEKNREDEKEERLVPSGTEDAAAAPKDESGSAAAEEAGTAQKSAERPGRSSAGRGRGHRRSRRPDKEEALGSVSDTRGTDSTSTGVPVKASVPKKRSAVPALTDEQIEEIRQKADTFLMDVFHAMNLEAEVSSVYDKETGMLTLDMKGENMGVLIGKRGQTLDSLQYLVSLVVNKGVDGYIHVKADTENYRERRKKTLENLAKNIASKVKRNRTSVALEPMNPYERRIIHSALQGDRYVTTYSEGEEPYRKVIVTMKES